MVYFATYSSFVKVLATTDFAKLFQGVNIPFCKIVQNIQNRKHRSR